MIIVFHRVSDICNSRFMLCQTYAWIQLFSSIINMPLKKNKMNEMKFMFTSQYGQSNAKFASKFRSNHLRWSIGKGILKKFAKCTEKHLCQSLFFNIVAGQPATLLNKRFWHRCFLLNFAKFLRTSILQNNSGGCFCKFALV